MIAKSNSSNNKHLIPKFDSIWIKGFFCSQDLNKHIYDEDGKIDYDKASNGGRLILDLLESKRYELVNSSEKVINGPYTHYSPESPNNDTKKSVLDLFIVSTGLSKHVDSPVHTKKHPKE